MRSIGVVCQLQGVVSIRISYLLIVERRKCFKIGETTTAGDNILV